MQFKAVQGIYYFDNEKEVFVTIPTSKGEIFKHSNLSTLGNYQDFFILNFK